MAFGSSSDKLEVVILATDEASGVLHGLAGQFGGLGNVVSGAFSVALGVGGAAVGALGAEIASAVKSASDSADVFAQTEAVIKSTGGAAGVTADEAAKLASSLQNTTRFSDETTLSAENMILTFTNIGKNIFPETTKTVLDMSQAIGEDTKSAAIQLGKALQDPIDGVTALRRVGVNFDQQQQDLIKTLVNSGKVEEAQKLILAELQKEFGGSAEAAGKTFAGQLEILKNQFDDVQEKIGGAFIPVIQHLITVMMPVIEKVLPVFVDLLTNQIAPAVNKVVDFIADLINWLGQEDPIRAFGDALAETFDGTPLGDFGHFLFDVVAPAFDQVKQTVTKVVGAINWFIRRIQAGQNPLYALRDTIREFLGVDITPFVEGFQTAFQNVKSYYDTNLKPIVDELTQKAVEGFTIAINFVQSGGLETTGKNIAQSFQPVVDWFKTNWPIIEATALTVWTVVQDVVKSTVDVIVGTAWPKLKDAFDQLGVAFGKLGISWSDVGAALMNGIKIVAEVIGAILIALVAIVVGIINGIASAIQFIVPVIEDVIKNGTAAFTGMVQFFVGIYTFFDKLFRGDFPGALYALQFAFQGAVTWITNTVLGMANIIKLVFGGIIAYISGWVQGVAQFFQDLYNRLVGHSIIPDMMNAIVAIIRIGMALITSIFASGWGVVTSQVNKLGQTIQTAISSALTFARNTLSQFQQFGSDIIAGILAGIAANARSLVDYITDVVNDTIQSVLDTLQISSPSKVFAGIGSNMMKGMQQGIAGAGMLPTNAVLDVTHNLVGKTTSAAAGGYNQSNYGPVTYQFNGLADPQSFLKEMKQLAGA